jgi:hypothetical protein
MLRNYSAMVAVLITAAGCGSSEEANPLLALSRPRNSNASAPAVPKAKCGATDRTETGLQGQTPLADRQSGATATAYNCNLEKVGQFQGEGASWQLAWSDNCAYYDQANDNTTPPTTPGTVVVDVSDPTNPKGVGYLTAHAMLDPWESLKVNDARKILGADKGPGLNITNFTPNPDDKWFSFYDITDCKNPKLLSDVAVDGFIGHTGDFSPDGKTYWGTAAVTGGLAAMDITDPTKPTLIINDLNFTIHDLAINADGTRLYGALLAPANGLIIIDVSDVQKRLANPQLREVTRITWLDGAAAQMPTPITISGKPYILFTDESSGRATSCAQGFTPFGIARIIDISDETNPVVISKIMLEVDEPANCTTTLADLVDFPGFGYDTHYCTVDNPANAKLAACATFQSGMRVYDIGDPVNPKEIAYYKPPAQGSTYWAGSNINLPLFGAPFVHTADWNSANSRFIWHGNDLQLWTTSQDNGFQVLQFTNGVGSDTTLPQPASSSSGCSAAGGNSTYSWVGLLGILGLLSLTRRRNAKAQGDG